MSDWRARAATLAAQLGAFDGVDPRWARAFAEAPRHVFVPRFCPIPVLPISSLPRTPIGESAGWTGCTAMSPWSRGTGLPWA